MLWITRIVCRKYTVTLQTKSQSKTNNFELLPENNRKVLNPLRLS